MLVQRWKHKFSYVDRCHHHVKHMCFVWCMCFVIILWEHYLYKCMQHQSIVVQLCMCYYKLLTLSYFFSMSNDRPIPYKCTCHYFKVNQHINIFTQLPGALQTIHSQIYSFTVVSTKRLLAFPQQKVHSSFFTAHSSQQLLQNLQLNQTQPQAVFGWTSTSNFQAQKL